MRFPLILLTAALVWESLLGAGSLRAQPGLPPEALALPEEPDAIPPALQLLENMPAPPPPKAEEFLLEAQFALPADEPPATVKSSGCWLRSGCWFFEGEALLLHRDMWDDIFLSTDLSNNQILHVGRTQSGMSPAARMTLGAVTYRDDLNRDYSAEFTYYGLGDWTTTSSMTAVIPGSVFSRINPPLLGFSGSTSQDFRYASDFDSYEWNYRIRTRLDRDRMILKPTGHWVQEANPGWIYSILGGIRTFHLDESFVYRSFDAGGNAMGRLATETSNNLVGVQIGGDLIYQFDRWNLGVRGAVGPYVNFNSHASQHTVTGGPNRAFADEDENVAFLGELGVFGTYYLRPNLTFRLSYQALFVNAVALAPEQIDRVARQQDLVRTGGGVWYQGFSLGWEWSW